MRHVVVLVGSFLAIGTAIAQPYPVASLVLEGDNVPGVGNVTSIANVAVNDLGDWLVEADTDNANTDADSVLLLNGVLLLREGDALTAPVGATLDSFDSVGLNGNGDSGWNFFIDGPPTTEDSGIYFNTTLVIQESDASTAAGFSAGTNYIGFFDAKLNDSNEAIVVASVDDPNIPSSVDRALVKLELDGAGALLSETVLAKEGDILPGQTAAVTELGTDAHESMINQAGQVLFNADLVGDIGIVYLDSTVIVREGDISPIAGRRFDAVTGRGLDLNNLGNVVYKADLDGATTDDYLIMRDDEVFVREGDGLAAIGAFSFVTFGLTSGPVRIDDSTNVFWFGDWDDPDTTVDTGLFLNDLLLVQEGVTIVDGNTMGTLANGVDAFALSENGRYAIFEGTLQNGTNGAFMIEIEAAPVVPDGNVVPGTQMRASNRVGNIDVTWDVSTCTADDYHLLAGALFDVAELTYVGGACNLGTTGSASFPSPAGSIYWIIVGVDGSNIEGAHGFDSQGAPRDASASGMCGVTNQILSSSCP